MRNGKDFVDLYMTDKTSFAILQSSYNPTPCLTYNTLQQRFGISLAQMLSYRLRFEVVRNPWDSSFGENLWKKCCNKATTEKFALCYTILFLKNCNLTSTLSGRLIEGIFGSRILGQKIKVPSCESNLIKQQHALQAIWWWSSCWLLCFFGTSSFTKKQFCNGQNDDACCQTSTVFYVEWNHLMSSWLFKTRYANQ